MRKPDRLNDYITRREAHALIVHVVSEVLNKMADVAPDWRGTDDPALAACEDAHVGYTVPTDSEGAES